MKVHY